MKIETERLILRAWEETDAEVLYELCKDERIGPITGFPVHTSVENSRQVIIHVLQDPETYAVCRKEDVEHPIGSIGLIIPARAAGAVENEIEIGYWLGVPYWGRGYIPEAVKALQKRAFETLGASAMWCGYYDGNTKSRRVMDKCGFTYHHTEANKPCVMMNDIRTEHFTYLTKENWRK